MKVKVLVYGAGRSLMQACTLLDYLERINDCEIIAIVSEDKYADTIYKWKYVDKEQVFLLHYDCIYLALQDDANTVKGELLNRGIPALKIIPREALFIPFYSFNRYLELKAQNLSIISNMCWGGVTYHYFHLQFLSPFINMFIKEDDYLTLLQNLQEYIDSPLEFSHIESEQFMHTEYPVFVLGKSLPTKGVFLHMNHYKSVQDGQDKWNVRKNRINTNNLLVMMYTQSPDIATAFDALPFEKKVCFTNFASPLSSVCYLDIFSKPPLLGLPSWNIISGLAAGRYVFYDPWELLLTGNHNNRWSIS